MWIGCRLLMPENSPDSGHSVSIESEDPVVSHLVLISLYRVGAVKVSVSYANAIRLPWERIRASARFPLGDYLSVTAERKVPLFDPVAFQLYCRRTLNAVPAETLVHACLDMGEKRTSGFVLACTNSLFEIGGRWPTPTGALVKASVAFARGKIGARPLVTGTDTPQMPGARVCFGEHRPVC
jgi:hypothetical protein